MRPILWEIDGRPVYGYWFFYGLGMLLAVLLAMWLARRRNLEFWKVWWMLMLSVLGAFAFARLGYVFFDPGFSQYGDLREGGEVSFGGMAGALLLALGWTLWKKLSLGDVLDIAAPSVLLGQGVQRVGCFCNGCCYGPVTDSFLGIQFPKYLAPSGDISGTPCFAHHLQLGLVERSASFSLPVVPMQLVSMTICLSVAAVCVCLFLKGKLRGSLLYLALVVYGGLRFVAQWFRPNYDLEQESWTWNIGHTAALVMVLAGGTFLYLRLKYGSDWAGFAAAQAEKKRREEKGRTKGRKGKRKR